MRGEDSPILLRHRPVTVEAWKVTADNLAQVAQWCDGFVRLGVTKGVALWTDTGNTVFADVGDWVIKGPFGNFYPAPDRIIFATYEGIVSVIDG